MSSTSSPASSCASIPSSSDPIIVSDVVKRFNDLTALDHVTLSVARGETFGLIGPNGSGKTTLIRLMLGLGRPNEGRIAVLGREMPDRRVAPRIGYMTQSSALYNELSVRENLAFFGTLYGLRGKRLKARLAATLELVDLTARATSPVQTLSGGMRQRVSLGCALIHEPELIFLDEPTVGIDPELRMAFWDYFAQLNQRGVTLIVSTHNLDEATRCHRLGLLRFGRLLAADTPAAIRKQSGQDNFEQAFLYFAQRAETAETTEAAETTESEA